MATDWYRCESWTKAEEEQFFTKLKRARKDGRAQYLRVQAIHLIETGRPSLLEVAESLLNKILTDYPEDRLEKSPALTMLGGIYRRRGDSERALEYFKRAMNFEKEFPNVVQGASLSFAEIVAEENRTELYDDVQEALLAQIEDGGLILPSQWYMIASVLTVVYASKGDGTKAIFYADIAAHNATATANTLWNPRKRDFGLVQHRNARLDRKVKEAVESVTRE